MDREQTATDDAVHHDARVDDRHEAEIDEELLIEEISIDGMCGVY